MNRTKRRIFEKSIELFANKGFEATSVEEITSVVGIAKGTLYYHFGSKEEIIEYLIQEGTRLLNASIKIKTGKAQTSIDKIKAIILIQIKVTVKYEGFVRLILSQMWGSGKRNLLCKKSVEDYIENIEEIVRQGIEKKEIINGNPTTMAYGIFGVISSCLIGKQKNMKNLDINDIYEEFSEYIVRSLTN